MYNRCSVCRAIELVSALYRGQREEIELLMQGIESHERGAEFKSRLTTELIYARQLVSSQREFDTIPKKVALNSATMVEVRVRVRVRAFAAFCSAPLHYSTIHM